MCIFHSLTLFSNSKQTPLISIHSNRRRLSAGPNIACCPASHQEAYFFFKHNLSKSSWPTVCVPSSLPHFQSSVRLEAPEHCAAGDLCDHDEVCCTHHSSAVINSARPQRNLWLSLRSQRSLLAPQPRCEATVRGKTESVHSLSSADRVLLELESGGSSRAAGKRGRLFVVTYLQRSVLALVKANQRRIPRICVHVKSEKKQKHHERELKHLLLNALTRRMRCTASEACSFSMFICWIWTKARWFQRVEPAPVWGCCH